MYLKTVGLISFSTQELGKKKKNPPKKTPPKDFFIVRVSSHFLPWNMFMQLFSLSEIFWLDDKYF